METECQMDLVKFQEFMTPQRVRTFQIIFGALLAGATVFLGVVLLAYMNSKSAPIGPMQKNSVLPILTVVHVAEATIAYIFAYFVYSFFSSQKGLEFLQKKAQAMGDPQSSLPIEHRYSGALFTASIFRAALLEGTALFVLVTCLVGVTSGEIHNQPLYWLNLLSYVIFVIVSLATFPTKERLENIFKETFRVL